MSSRNGRKTGINRNKGAEPEGLCGLATSYLWYWLPRIDDPSIRMEMMSEIHVFSRRIRRSLPLVGYIEEELLDFEDTFSNRVSGTAAERIRDVIKAYLRSKAYPVEQQIGSTNGVLAAYGYSIPKRWGWRQKMKFLEDEAVAGIVIQAHAKTPLRYIPGWIVNRIRRLYDAAEYGNDRLTLEILGWRSETDGDGCRSIFDVLDLPRAKPREVSLSLEERDLLYRAGLILSGRIHGGEAGFKKLRRIPPEELACRISFVMEQILLNSGRDRMHITQEALPISGPTASRLFGTRGNNGSSKLGAAWEIVREIH